MPDKDGNLLPPIEEETFDGDKQKVELKEIRCKHNMNFISPSEIRCVKCGVGYTGTPKDVASLYELFDNL